MTCSYIFAQEMQCAYTNQKLFTRIKERLLISEEAPCKRYSTVTREMCGSDILDESGCGGAIPIRPVSSANTVC